MKKFVCAAFCTFALVGFVMADEFGALITKIDKDTVTYYKTKKGEGGKKGFGAQEKDGPELKAKIAKGVKVVQAKFDADAGKLVAGDPLENGLENDFFKMI